METSRSNRPDAFGEYTGLLSDEGEKWHDIRSKVQQDMMRPQSTLYYTEMLQEVADDFVKHVELNRGAGKCSTVVSLISICVSELQFAATVEP